ncbi:type II secretion system protein [Candidatus Saccharibacteria bacterium]|nr:type II secretion system protein [Candidatus Saccharibacteria bacterium]
MLNNLKQRKSEGFTIIEVMIVLAIAGLILLIVFLAVPALQRNSRNTSAKNDAAAVAGAINEFQSNNDGSMPTAVSGTGTVTASASGLTSATGKVQGSTTVSTSASAPASITAGTVVVRLQYKCDGTANNRAAAVFYPVEASTGNPSVKCLET